MSKTKVLYFNSWKPAVRIKVWKDKKGMINVCDIGEERCYRYYTWFDWFQNFSKTYKWSCPVLCRIIDALVENGFATEQELFLFGYSVQVDEVDEIDSATYKFPVETRVVTDS